MELIANAPHAGGCRSPRPVYSVYWRRHQLPPFADGDA